LVVDRDAATRKSSESSRSTSCRSARRALAVKDAGRLTTRLKDLAVADDCSRKDVLVGAAWGPGLKAVRRRHRNAAEFRPVAFKQIDMRKTFSG
jgi:hypothetical protein